MRSFGVTDFNFCSAFILVIIASLGVCCSDEISNHRFESLESKETGILFQNTLQSTEQLNPYTYKGFFNGGGVGLGDLDNDGLVDIIFTGNSVNNAVYKNLGNWKFQDITRSSGLGGEGVWNTGVSIADVNGDGWLDVFLCKSGPPMQPNRSNELRINNQDGTFTDVARTAGLDDRGYSTHVSFIDFDRDGDLDIYLLNNSVRAVGGFDLRPNARLKRSRDGANKLLKNMLVESDSLHFIDVSEKAGIYGSDIGFGLGVACGDVNGDMWPDMYVSNDFFERDYLYINTGEGSFSEQLTLTVAETSMGAMGADMADLNNDLYPEIFVTEMLPSEPYRYKTKAQFSSFDKQLVSVQNGYHFQFGRNSLLLNNQSSFSETSRFYGVSASDWSWGALLADLDNDGFKDIYVANGILKDLLDQDYINFIAPGQDATQLSFNGKRALSLLDSMPSQPVANACFKNPRRDTSFEDVSEDWGLGQLSFSNGSAYGDLDNDGDLDLVVNTINAEPLVYENTTRELYRTSYVTVVLKDTISKANKFGVGSKVTVYAQDLIQTADLFPARGFMSCVDPRVHFGLADATKIDSVVVEWSSGGKNTVKNPPISKALLIERTDVASPQLPKTFAESRSHWKSFSYPVYEENTDLFKQYPLIPEMPLRNSTHIKNESIYTFRICQNEVCGPEISLADDQVNIGVNDQKLPIINLQSERETSYLNQIKELELEVKLSPDQVLSTGYWKEVYLNEEPVGPSGLWQCAYLLNDDNINGKIVVLGNVGLNSSFNASFDQPLEMHLSDLDNNGTFEQLLVMEYGGKRTLMNNYLKLASRSPAVRKAFNRFSSYANANPEDILSLGEKEAVLKASELRSGYFVFQEDSLSQFIPFPDEVQKMRIRVVEALNLPSGVPSLYLHGNFSYIRPEYGSQLSGTGIVLQWLNEQWVAKKNIVPPISGEITAASQVGNYLVLVRNNESPVYTELY